jgi:hypothetical protein
MWFAWLLLVAWDLVLQKVMGRHGFPNWGKFSMTARVAPVALRVSCDRACLWLALPKGCW